MALELASSSETPASSSTYDGAIWTRLIEASGVSLGEKQKTSKQALLETLLGQEETHFIIRQQPKEDKASTTEISVSREMLDSEITQLLEKTDGDGFAFTIDTVNSAETIKRRYGIEYIAGEIFVSTLVTSKENLRKELSDYLGEKKINEAFYIINQGSEDGFAVEGGAVLVKTASDILGVDLVSGQQRDVYNITHANGGALVTVETKFDKFISIVDTVRLQENVRITATFEIKLKGNEMSCSSKTENNLDSCRYGILKVAAMDIAKSLITSGDLVDNARHLRIRHIEKFLKETKPQPHVDSEFEKAILMICHRLELKKHKASRATRKYLTQYLTKQFKATLKVKDPAAHDHKPNIAELLETSTHLKLRAGWKKDVINFALDHADVFADDLKKLAESGNELLKKKAEEKPRFWWRKVSKVRQEYAAKLPWPPVMVTTTSADTTKGTAKKSVSLYDFWIVRLLVGRPKTPTQKNEPVASTTPGQSSDLVGVMSAFREGEQEYKGQLSAQQLAALDETLDPDLTGVANTFEAGAVVLRAANRDASFSHSQEGSPRTTSSSPRLSSQNSSLN